MLAAAMIFCLIAVTFGLTVLLSPHVNDTINALITDMNTTGKIGIGSTMEDAKNATYTFQKTLFNLIYIITEGSGVKFITITPSIVTISYIPLAVGGGLFLWLIAVTIILNVGFKSVNKKNIKQVVNPIKWYSIAVSSVWFTFIVMLIVMFLAYVGASTILFGRIVTMSPDHFLFNPDKIWSIDDNGNYTEWLKTKPDFQLYWLTGDLINNTLKQDRLDGSDNYFVFIIPVAPFILAFILQVIGLATGSVSWKWVNLYVLAAIGDPTALEMVNHRLPLKKPLVYEGDELSDYGAPKNRGLSQNEAQNVINIIDYSNELTGEDMEDMPKKRKQKPNRKEMRRQQQMQQRQARQRQDDYDDYETYDDYDDMTTKDDFVPQQKRMSKKQMKQQARMERRNIVDVTSDWDDDNMSFTTSAKSFGTSATLKAQCVSFFKNCIKMMEQSDSTSNSLYKKFVSAYDALISNRVDGKLDDIAAGIEDYITFATEVDQKFIKLVSKVLGTNRTVFGTFSVELDDLISRYKNALRAWNMFEAELLIEQIFAIATQNTELLAKVGFCLKYRLSNHYSFIERKLNGIRRLNVARESKNYEAYRQTCLQIIKTMSPNKLLVSGIVNQVY
jgi:hypothetical protein